MKDDAISRQAAIDAINMLKISEDDSFVECPEECNSMIYAVIDAIEALPSAEPDIDGYSTKLWKAAYERGKRSAEAEIIRCKDCKHRYMEGMIWRCPFGLMGGENFFCGYGSLGTVEVEGLPSAEPLDAQEAYYKGKMDAFDECAAFVKKLNGEIKQDATS